MKDRRLIKKIIVTVIIVAIVVFVGIQLIPVKRTNPPVTMDVDADGFNDVIMGDRGGTSGFIWAYDNNSNQLWNFSIPSSIAPQDHIFSLSVEDVNDDGYQEVIRRSSIHTYYI